MAEGGHEEFEMGEFNPAFPEYDDMSNEELTTEMSALKNSLLTENVDTADTTERIRYIANRLLSPIVDTSFVEGSGGTVTISTGGDGEVSVPSISHRLAKVKDSDKVVYVNGFIEDNHGVKVDWNSYLGKNLESRLGFSKDGNITFRRVIKGGTPARDGNIVLKRNRDGTFRYNDDEGSIIGYAVSGFRDIVDRLVEQAKKEGGPNHRQGHG